LSVTSIRLLTSFRQRRAKGWGARLLGTDPPTARWSVNLHRNSTLAFAKALKLCATAQGFTSRAVIRLRRSGACPGAAWIGTRAGSRQGYAVPSGRNLMHQSTGAEITHGFIQRRLGGKLWQAQLMAPIRAWVQRSEFGHSFSTNNRSRGPRSRARRTPRLSAGVRSFEGSGPTLREPAQCEKH
jgi:hypothetical protein